MCKSGHGGVEGLHALLQIFQACLPLDWQVNESRYCPCKLVTSAEKLCSMAAQDFEEISGHHRSTFALCRNVDSMRDVFGVRCSAGAITLTSVVLDMLDMLCKRFCLNDIKDCNSRNLFIPTWSRQNLCYTGCSRPWKTIARDIFLQSFNKEVWLSNGLISQQASF